MLQNRYDQIDQLAEETASGHSPAPPEQLRTLVDVARWRADNEPHQIAFTFLEDGEHEAESLTYSELDCWARSVAAELQTRGAAGERVLLLLRPGLGFVASVFGCLYSGALAVPVNPPDPLRLRRTLPRLRAIVEDAQAKFVVGSHEFLKCAGGGFQGASDLQTIAWETIPLDLASVWRPIGADDQQLALLQYTSGATGSPRGVTLTHANLMHSFAAMHQEDVRDAVGVTWLPPYHDMGLIGGTLLPVFSGRRIVVMSPLSFVERPVRWLRAISRYNVKTTGGPDFAYELCVRRVQPEECEGLDLNCWKIAVVGAEPVLAETLDRFAEMFRPFGFRREAFLPAYGLAEAVLNVTGGRWYESPVVRTFSARAIERNRVEAASPEDPDGRRLVGCGKPWRGHRIAIVAPASCEELGPGQVGEIWVQSPNAGTGYWNRPKETERAFHARLAHTGEGPFLRTGDLGFLDDGELFVTGRLKELIVLGGRSYYPHDIERVVSRSHPTLSNGNGAAFACDVNGRKRLVVLHEARRSKRHRVEEVLASVRRSLAEEYPFSPYAVVLVPGGVLPKTSSGKPRRRACRAMYLGGELDVLIQWTENAP